MRSLLQLKLLCVSYMEIPGAELRFFSKLLPSWQLLSSCCHCQASLCLSVLLPAAWAQVCQLLVPVRLHYVLGQKMKLEAQLAVNWTDVLLH